jgi:YbbR domain-containing protein
MSYPLDTNELNIPRGVTIARITPPVIHLRLEPVSKRTLPVSVRLSGKPTAGYRVAQATPLPANVSVQGPAEEVRRLAVIETVAVDVEEMRGAFKRRVRLSNDGKPLSISPDQVEVTVAIEQEQAIRTFERIEVYAKDFGGVYQVVPPSVSLRIAGPKMAVEKLKLTSDQVYLNLKGLSVGEHNVPLELDLPAEVKVLEQRPQRFRVRITKPAE